MRVKIAVEEFRSEAEKAKERRDMLISLETTMAESKEYQDDETVTGPSSAKRSRELDLDGKMEKIGKLVMRFQDTK